MKVHCPKCQQVVDIKNKSRYRIFTCRCKNSFRGLYAKVSKANALMGLLLPSKSVTSWPAFIDSTPCPHCDEWVSKKYDGGWPSVCRTCHKDLPITQMDK